MRGERNDFICWLRLALDLFSMSKTTWSKVCSKSTSQLIYHKNKDQILIMFMNAPLSWSVSGQLPWRPDLTPAPGPWPAALISDESQLCIRSEQKCINTQTNMKRNHWRMLMCDPNQLSSADMWWMNHDHRRMNVLRNIVYSDRISADAQVTIWSSVTCQHYHPMSHHPWPLIGQSPVILGPDWSRLPGRLGHSFNIKDCDQLSLRPAQWQATLLHHILCLDIWNISDFEIKRELLVPIGDR